jgi:outer membrane protein assembly factor BamB
MIKKYRNPHFLCFLASCVLLSCQSSVPLDISLKDPDLSLVKSLAPDDAIEVQQKKQVSLHFGLNFSQAFVTQCASCKPRYVRLRIQGSQNISEPLYAINADDNGFIEIDPDTPLQSLSAEVPEGNNWAAFASLHMNNDADSQPLARIGGVFHNPPPTAEQIELSKRALQTAEIVNAMHDLGDDRLFSALDLQRYQAMTDALLGVEQNPDGTYTLGRVPNGEILDAETLARLLNTGELNPEQPSEAALLPVEALLPKPQVKTSVRLQSFTAGLSKLVMNSQSKGVFAYDILQNQRRMYGFQGPGLESILNPYDLGDLRNVYLSLGQANPTGSQTLPVTYTYANEGLDRMVLRARSQTANHVVWSYTFENIPALRSDYVPTVFRDTQDTLDPSDDTDHVYVTFNADRFNHPEQRGVYAIEEGQKLWHVNIDKDFNIAGALNASGDRLYVISRSNPSTPSRLYAINTSEGVANPEDRLLWDISLRGATESSGGETFTTSTPVMGKNGDIYLTTFSLPPNFKLGDSLPGFLRCISPEGQERWAFPLASSSGFSPVVDHRDGQDLIYLTTDRGQVLAIDGAGVQRWETLLPGTAGEGPVDAPLIGEDLDGGRTLYQGMGNGLIYAVKDRGSRGEILWAQAPQAKVSRGMVLKDGFLYAPTLDGGEGQTVQIKGIQVHSLGLASTAPWPITGGNLAAQHISALTQEGY